jgi:hypothetical protein
MFRNPEKIVWISNFWPPSCFSHSKTGHFVWFSDGHSYEQVKFSSHGLKTDHLTLGHFLTIRNTDDSSFWMLTVTALRITSVTWLSTTQ